MSIVSNRRRLGKAHASSVGEIHSLIRSGGPVSRSELARRAQLAASTVTARVDTLLEHGLVHETGKSESRGGRRGTRLELDPSAGFVAAAVLGANHCRVTLSDATGEAIATSGTEDGSLPMPDLAAGEDAVAAAVWNGIVRLGEEARLPRSRFLGAAISIPGPVEYPSGRIVTPSFMPSWNGADLPSAFATHTGKPVLIENDTNLIALSERAGAEGAGDHILAVKIGTRIGSGILIDGSLYRGATGTAGEIAHTPVPGISEIPCTCPVQNCLESVASGGALLARLRRDGIHVEDVAGLLRMAEQRVPAAASALREAADQIGSVIATTVNFLNPRTVVLTGAMAASAIFVGAVRAQVFRCCLPISAEHLEVRTAHNPAGAEAAGATTLILDHVLSPARIDEIVSAGHHASDRGAGNTDQERKAG